VRRHLPHPSTPWEGYAPPEERPPLGAYAGFATAFVVGLGAFVVSRRQRSGLPEALRVTDVVLIGAAGFQLSRLISKKKVSAFVRAPFTEYQGSGDAPGELDERPRGEGVRGAIGQLLVCPYCLDVWTATVGVVGLVTIPRETRVVASILTAAAVSDLLQVAYRGAASE
jgi:hypothetical protein